MLEPALVSGNAWRHRGLALNPYGVVPSRKMCIVLVGCISMMSFLPCKYASPNPFPVRVVWQGRTVAYWPAGQEELAPVTVRVC